MTTQRFLDMQTYMDISERICFCCDGGLNRSVMAANILTHMAKERDLPVIGEARAAYPNTQGLPVQNQVWETLERYGIRPEKTHTTAQYLEDDEAPHFTSFAGISDGALERLFRLDLQKEKVEPVSRFFFGIRDPEYGEVTHEQAFMDLYEKAEKYLVTFELGYRKHIKAARSAQDE